MVGKGQRIRGNETVRLKIQRDLRRERARRHVVRPAERGQEVIQRVIVGDVDRGQVEVHLVAVGVEEVVLADRDVEQVARSDARWVVVVVPGARRGNPDAARS